MKMFLGEAVEEAAVKSLSISSQAFQLFLENKTLVEIAIILDISTEEVIKIFSNYLTLQNMGKVAAILRDHRNDLPAFLKWFNYIKENKTRKKDVAKAIDNINQINTLIQQKERLEKEIQTIIEERDCPLHNLQDIKATYH